MGRDYKQLMEDLSKHAVGDEGWLETLLGGRGEAEPKDAVKESTLKLNLGELLGEDLKVNLEESKSSLKEKDSNDGQ